ncbi:MAG: EpsG family protein [Oscillospiraceae bacterium]|nr:EpsG family protein [Oscillospiraceae bacterium]
MTLIAASLVLTYLSERAYVVGGFQSKASRSVRNTLFLFVIVLLTCFIGLRTYYNDTDAYRGAYEGLKGFPEFWQHFDATLGANPGFCICNAAIKTLGISWHGMFLIYSLITMASTMWLIRKYSLDLVTSLFLFFATNAYTLTGAALKQCLAIAIGSLAIPFALKKKWIPFGLILLLASTFHPYILMYLIAPLLTFKPWTRWTYVLIAATLFAGYMFEQLVGVMIDMAALVGDEYTEEKMMGEGINVLRVLVSMAPIVLSYLYRRDLFRNSTKQEHLFMNLSMVNASIMFVGLFGSSIAFSRLAGYFTLMQCIALPVIIMKLPNRDKPFWKTMMIAGYIGFFLYANVMAGSFDRSFSRITLWEYIRQFSQII